MIDHHLHTLHSPALGSRRTHRTAAVMVHRHSPSIAGAKHTERWKARLHSRLRSRRTDHDGLQVEAAMTIV